MIIGERLRGSGESGVKGWPDLVGGDGGQVGRWGVKVELSGIRAGLRAKKSWPSSVRLKMILVWAKTRFSISPVKNSQTSMASILRPGTQVREGGSKRLVAALKPQWFWKCRRLRQKPEPAPAALRGGPHSTTHSPQRRSLQPQPYFSAAASSVQFLPLTTDH